jgi:hypothetical protein
VNNVVFPGAKEKRVFSKAASATAASGSVAENQVLVLPSINQTATVDIDARRIDGIYLQETR